MKNYRTFLLIAVCVPIVSGCGSTLSKLTSGGAVTLKRTFKEGEVASYLQTSDMKMTGAPGAPDSGFKMTADLVRTYGKVDSSGAVDAEIKTSNLKVDGPNAAAMQSAMPKDISMKAHIDPQGMMKMTMEGDKSNAALAMTGSMLGEPIPDGVQFPTKAVKPGDSWTTPFSQLKSLGVSGDTKQTYVGETTQDGKQVYHIKIEGHFDLGKNPSSADANNPMSKAMASMKGTVDVSGDAYLDEKDCSILATTTSTKTEIEIPSMKTPMTQQMTVEVKRVK